MNTNTFHYTNFVNDIGTYDLTFWQSTPINYNSDVYKDVPNVIKTFIEVVNNIINNNPYYIIISIDGLNTQQRHILYINLSEFNITWWKNTLTKSICININNIWKIPERFTNNNFPVYIRSIQSNITLYNSFYDRVPYNTNPYLPRWYIVSSNNFVRHRRMLDICIIRYHSHLSNNIIITNINPFTNNSNNKIELSNLIFDIKLKLTDQEYKTIMEKISIL